MQREPVGAARPPAPEDAGSSQRSCSPEAAVAGAPAAVDGYRAHRRAALQRGHVRIVRRAPPLPSSALGAWRGSERRAPSVDRAGRGARIHRRASPSVRRGRGRRRAFLEERATTPLRRPRAQRLRAGWACPPRPRGARRPSPSPRRVRACCTASSSSSAGLPARARSIRRWPGRRLLWPRQLGATAPARAPWRDRAAPMLASAEVDQRSRCPCRGRNDRKVTWTNRPAALRRSTSTSRAACRRTPGAALAVQPLHREEEAAIQRPGIGVPQASARIAREAVGGPGVGGIC